MKAVTHIMFPDSRHEVLLGDQPEGLVNVIDEDGNVIAIPTDIEYIESDPNPDPDEAVDIDRVDEVLSDPRMANVRLGRGAVQMFMGEGVTTIDQILGLVVELGDVDLTDLDATRSRLKKVILDKRREEGAPDSQPRYRE